jgi:uncharacterized damage-inducible protein DinB
VPAVKEAFTYCDDAFAGLTNENALDMLTVGSGANQRQLVRANQLTMVIVHGNEHYGNLVTYMRIHGIVPPSSAPPPPASGVLPAVTRLPSSSPTQ